MKMSSGFHSILVILFICFLYSCNKIHYYPDKEYSEVNTLILAHRAGGGGTSNLQENSLEAAKYGLSILDGIEVDIQLSKSRTLWLYHGAELPVCGGITYECFPEIFDNQIIELDSCNGDEYNFTKLEEIFAFMSLNYPDKHISLDVQPWYPCAFTSINIVGEMNVIADEVIRLTEKYNLQNCVMVESQTATFLDNIKKNSTGIESYLTSWGGPERAMLLALSAGYTGISVKFKPEYEREVTAEDIYLMRKKGLKIQLWTVNSEEDIIEAVSIKPDYIQTDNFEYFEQLN
jgi:glycerophosphoryl diester phosphodiesterase